MVKDGVGGRFKLPVIKAGGMDVLDHIKEGLIQPDVLIDVLIDRPPKIRGPARRVRDAGPALEMMAHATLVELIEYSVVLQRVPVIVQALQDAATPQVRNVATVAGNLLQRPRCWYYRNEQFNCLKKGGPTCFAVDGENQY